MNDLPGDWADAQGTATASERTTAGLPWAWVGESCAWCGIRAGAVPDEPPIQWEGAWWHRRGCYPSARFTHYGYLPEGYGPSPEQVEAFDLLTAMQAERRAS